MYCALRNRAWPSGSCRHMAGTQASCTHADDGGFHRPSVLVRAAAGWRHPRVGWSGFRKSSVSTLAVEPG
ncbi:MAG: hypothetical protein AW07_01380 [Candidatus Accumulibacter sp. SK-11]|nr:MAG: hypothetical protein AW07_01380 [Candidatus Accumulibacter sp. SK-11]